MKELIDLYLQPSYDAQDIEKIRQIVINALAPEGYIDEVDEKGNLFLYHPKSTCKTLLCAHMDMVKTGKPIQRVMNVNGLLMGLDENNDLTSLGADDKNGVWLCIQAGKKVRAKPSILLVAHEEGAPHTVDDFIEKYGAVFTDYDNCLVLDRQGEKEIIYRGSWKDYSALLACQWKKCNPEWVFAKGVMCDADRLNPVLPTINLSIGYYDGHQRGEFTCLPELKAVRDALFKFLRQTETEMNTIDWKVIKEFKEETKVGII